MKKILSLLLCFVLVFSTIPLSFAEEVQKENTEVITQEEDNKEESPQVEEPQSSEQPEESPQVESPTENTPEETPQVETPEEVVSEDSQEIPEQPSEEQEKIPEEESKENLPQSGYYIVPKGTQLLVKEDNSDDLTLYALVSTDTISYVSLIDYDKDPTIALLETAIRDSETNELFHQTFVVYLAELIYLEDQSQAEGYINMLENIPFNDEIKVPEFQISIYEKNKLDDDNSSEELEGEIEENELVKVIADTPILSWITEEESKEGVSGIDYEQRPQNNFFIENTGIARVEKIVDYENEKYARLSCKTIDNEEYYCYALLNKLVKIKQDGIDRTPIHTYYSEGERVKDPRVSYVFNTLTNLYVSGANRLLSEYAPCTGYEADSIRNYYSGTTPRTSNYFRYRIPGYTEWAFCLQPALNGPPRSGAGYSGCVDGYTTGYSFYVPGGKENERKVFFCLLNAPPHTSGNLSQMEAGAGVSFAIRHITGYMNGYAGGGTSAQGNAIVAYGRSLIDQANSLKNASANIVTLKEPYFMNGEVWTQIRIDVSNNRYVSGASMPAYDWAIDSNSLRNIAYISKTTGMNGDIVDIKFVQNPGDISFSASYYDFDSCAYFNMAKADDKSRQSLGYASPRDARATGRIDFRIPVSKLPKFGKLQIIKKDATNGEGIEGVEFELISKADSSKKYTIVTNNEGIGLQDNLPFGDYTLQEISAPSSYKVDNTIHDITIKVGETFTYELENERNGLIKVIKKDSETGKRIPGVKFSLKSLADPNFFREGVTDADGSIVWYNLPDGKYIIEETEIPLGYTPNKITKAKITVKSNMRWVEFPFTNTPIKGSIEILKTDKDTNKVLKNATFAVKRIKGIPSLPENDQGIGEIYEIKTNENGIASIDGLTYGTYEVYEKTAPEGFKIIDKSEVINIDADKKQIKLSFKNEIIKNKIRIYKIDQETKAPLANGHFTIKKISGSSDYDDADVGKIFNVVTDETGYATSETLTYGTYEILEIKAPEGYYIDENNHDTIKISSEGEEYTTTMIDKKVLGNVVLTKKGSMITGFTTEIVNVGGVNYNVKKPYVEVKYLEGAEFTIYAREDIKKADGTIIYAKDGVVGKIVTENKADNTYSNLPLGKYYMIETKVPANYKLNEQKYEFELKAGDKNEKTVTVNVEAENDLTNFKTQFLKKKEMIETVEREDGTVGQNIIEVPAKDITFGLFAGELIEIVQDSDNDKVVKVAKADELIDIRKSDENGQVIFDGKYPKANYYIKELATDEEHFLIDGKIKEFGKDTESNDSNDAVLNKLKYKNVTITKTELTSEKTVPGATIEVYDETTGKLVYRAVTDKDGNIPDIKVQYNHKYKFIETIAPEGYALNIAEMRFSVTDDGEIVGDTKIKDDYTRVQIMKVDEGNKALEGAEFILVKKTKQGEEKLMSAISNKDGLVTFEKIPYGSFVIKEVSPVDGYVLSEKEFTINVDGKFVNPTKPIGTIKNIPNEVIIKKVDNNNNPLAGVKFGLFDAKEIKLQEAISDENGIVKFTKIPAGDYVIKETETVQGYVLNDEKITLHIDKTWKNTSEPFKTIVNNPVPKKTEKPKEGGGGYSTRNGENIQTGVEENPVVYIGLAFIAISLVGVYMTLKRKKRI